MRKPRATIPAQVRRPATPVQTVKPHPLAWAEALRRVDGDLKRLSVDADGAVWIR